jgi:hypothetical protein
LIKENSVIMQNPEPIFYPVSHPYVQKAKEKARDQGKSEEEVAGIKIQVKGRYVLKESIALSEGYNIVTLKAKDKFGHQDEKNYKLTYQKNI